MATLLSRTHGVRRGFRALSSPRPKTRIFISFLARKHLSFNSEARALHAEPSMLSTILGRCLKQIPSRA